MWKTTAIMLLLLFVCVIARLSALSNQIRAVEDAQRLCLTTDEFQSIMRAMQQPA